MAAFPRHSRDCEHAEYSSAMLDRLLDGVRPADDSPPQVQALAHLLAAVRAPAASPEIMGEAQVADAFISVLSAFDESATPRRRRFMLATILGSKLATAAAAGAIGFGGVAAAAYTGALPEPIQDFAHETVGAPAADKDQGSQQSDAAREGQPASDGAVGPDATGPAMFGLCTAFAEEKEERGKVDTHSVAFRELAEAAGGADEIDEFCADVTAADSAAGTAPAPDHPDGMPTSVPTDAPPTDVPLTPEHPTGPPSDPPARN